MRDQNFRSTLHSKSLGFPDGYFVRNKDRHFFDLKCDRLFKDEKVDNWSKAVPKMLNILCEQSNNTNEIAEAASNIWVKNEAWYNKDKSIIDIYWEGLSSNLNPNDFTTLQSNKINIAINIIRAYMNVLTTSEIEKPNLFTMIYALQSDFNSTQNTKKATVEYIEEVDWRPLLSIALLFTSAFNSRKLVQRNVEEMAKSLWDKIQFEFIQKFNDLPQFFYESTIEDFNPILEKVLGSSWTNYRKNYMVVSQNEQREGSFDFEKAKKKLFTLIVVCIYRAAVISVAFEKCMEPLFQQENYPIDIVTRQELLHSIVPRMSTMPMSGETIVVDFFYWLANMPSLDHYAMLWFWWANPKLNTRNQMLVTDDSTGTEYETKSKCYLSKFKEELKKIVDDNLEKLQMTREQIQEETRNRKQQMNNQREEHSRLQIMKRIQKKQYRREKKIAKYGTPSSSDHSALSDTPSSPSFESPFVDSSFQDERDNECAVCLTQVPNVQYFPCRHHVVCEDCDNSITDLANRTHTKKLCPMCRHNVEEVKTLFL